VLYVPLLFSLAASLIAVQLGFAWGKNCPTASSKAYAVACGGVYVARSKRISARTARYGVRLGLPATLVTSFEPFGAALSQWAYGLPGQQPAGHQIEYVQGHPSGGGTGYIGTIDNVEVFTASIEQGRSVLFPATMLDAVSYRLVTPDSFFSVEYEEGDDPWSGTVLVRFAQETVWHDKPIIDLVTEDAPLDEEAPTAVE
jgi:hypothetical protein